MGEEKRHTPLDDDLLTHIGGGAEAGEGCSLPEGQFPLEEKCHEGNRTFGGKALKPLCPYCTLWTSLPEGANLVVASIFECTRHGYVRRITR